MLFSGFTTLHFFTVVGTETMTYCFCAQLSNVDDLAEALTLMSGDLIKRLPPPRYGRHAESTLSDIRMSVATLHLDLEPGFRGLLGQKHSDYP